MDDHIERLERISRSLAQLGLGNYGVDVELDAQDDLLGKVERGVNGLIMDLQTLDMANQEKAALAPTSATPPGDARSA